MRNPGRTKARGSRVAFVLNARISLSKVANTKDVSFRRGTKRQQCERQNLSEQLKNINIDVLR